MIHRLIEHGRQYLAQNPQIVQTIAAFAIKIIGALLSFGFTIIIGRHFGPAGVGQFGLALTTLTITSTFALVGLDYILIRTVAGDLKIGYQPQARGVMRTVAMLVVCNAVLLAVLLGWVGVPLLAARFQNPADALVLNAVTFGVVPLAMMRITSSSLRSCGHVLLAQFLDGPLSMALTIMAVTVLLWSGISSTVVSAGIIYVVAVAICVAIGALIQWHTTRHWPPPSHVRLPPLLSQGWPILCIVLAGFVVDWLILVTLAGHRSAAEVGLFRTVWQVASIFNLVIVSFDAVAGPRIAAAYRIGDINGIGHMWRQAVVIIMLLSLPLFILTLFFPALVLSLFGPEFQGGATALRIMVAGQLVNALTGPIGSVLIMTGRERWSLANSMTSLGICLFLALLLIPAHGLIGAAVASAATQATRNLIGWILANRSLKIALNPNQHRF